jgi:hypothetical protein
MVDENRSLVARILLLGAAVLVLLGGLCWTGTLPVDPGARRVLALAFGIAAAADALIGFIFLTKARDSRP